MLLKSEKGFAKICCHNGKVKLPLYDMPEEPPAETSAAGAAKTGAARRNPEEEESTRRLARTRLGTESSPRVESCRV